MNNTVSKCPQAFQEKLIDLINKICTDFKKPVLSLY